AAEGREVVPRHRGLHHLHGAAGKAERHPHERAGARPSNEIVSGGDKEALVGKLIGKTCIKGVVLADWIPSLDSRARSAAGGRDRSHSSAPFFHSYAKPTVSTIRKAIIEPNANWPISGGMCGSEMAHGNRNATSRSKMMKRIETR